MYLPLPSPFGYVGFSTLSDSSCERFLVRDSTGASIAMILFLFLIAINGFVLDAKVVKTLTLTTNLKFQSARG